MPNLVLPTLQPALVVVGFPFQVQQHDDVAGWMKSSLEETNPPLYSLIANRRSQPNEELSTKTELAGVKAKQIPVGLK